MAAPRQNDRVSLPLENALDHHADHGVVVDDQNSCHAEPPMPARRIQQTLRIFQQTPRIFANVCESPECECIPNVDSCQALQRFFASTQCNMGGTSFFNYLFALRIGFEPPRHARKCMRGIAKVRSAISQAILRMRCALVERIVLRTSGAICIASIERSAPAVKFCPSPAPNGVSEPNSMRSGPKKSSASS